MVLFPSNCELAEAGSTSSKPILASAYCLSMSFGQAFKVCPAEKTGARFCGSCINISGFRPKGLFQLAAYG